MRLATYLAEYLMWRRRFDDLITVSRAAREAAQRAGNCRGEGTAWNNSGNALREMGRAEEAIDAHTHWSAPPSGTDSSTARRAPAAAAGALARDLFQAVGDRHREGLAWNNLGVALDGANRVEEEAEAYGKALEIRQEFQDWYGPGVALDNLALVHEGNHKPVQAHSCWLRAADAYDQAEAAEEVENARVHAEALTSTMFAPPTVTP